MFLKLNLTKVSLGQKYSEPKKIIENTIFSSKNLKKYQLFGFSLTNKIIEFGVRSMFVNDNDIMHLLQARIIWIMFVIRQAIWLALIIGCDLSSIQNLPHHQRHRVYVGAFKIVELRLNIGYINYRRSVTFLFKQGQSPVI